MAEPINLAARRADADCRAWTVADALRDALGKVERGEIKADMVFIGFAAETPNGIDSPSIRAGGSNLELSGLLAHHLMSMRNF